jgi:hypothetical protein
MAFRRANAPPHRYNRIRSPGFTPDQQSDLVEYLKIGLTKDGEP